MKTHEWAYESRSRHLDGASDKKKTSRMMVMMVLVISFRIV